MGTVPESEIEELEKEDAKFPNRAVIYLRSVSEIDGKLEAIMRVVMGEIPATATFFNYHFAIKQGATLKARIPHEVKYPDEAYQKFLAEKFPMKTEFGRVVFAKGVNEFRVLMDLCHTGIRLSYFPTASGTGHYLIVESVRLASHRYL